MCIRDRQNTILCIKFDEHNVKLNDIDNSFDVNDSKFDEQNIKFNELSSNINEQSIKLDSKFDEVNTNIMKQINKHCDELIVTKTKH